MIPGQCASCTFFFEVDGVNYKENKYITTGPSSTKDELQDDLALLEENNRFQECVKAI